MTFTIKDAPLELLQRIVEDCKDEGDDEELDITVQVPTTLGEVRRELQRRRN